MGAVEVSFGVPAWWGLLRPAPRSSPARRAGVGAEPAGDTAWIPESWRRLGGGKDVPGAGEGCFKAPRLRAPGSHHLRTRKLGLQGSWGPSHLSSFWRVGFEHIRWCSGLTPDSVLRVTPGGVPETLDEVPGFRPGLLGSPASKCLPSLLDYDFQLQGNILHLVCIVGVCWIPQELKFLAEV